MMLIVDDVDTQPDYRDLTAMLAAVVRRDASVRLRVILVGRDFGEWWGQLRDGLDPVVDAKLKPPGHTRLSAMGATTADQEQLFDVALGHYARRFGRSVPSVGLTGLTLATPIAELHAAAASAAYHSLTGSVSIDAALQHLFRSEEAWWLANAAAWSITSPLPVLQAAVTAATLVGADDRAQCARRLACLPGLTTASTERLDDLARWLHQLYTQRGGTWLDPHLPAQLAERYAVRCATAQPSLPSALAAAALTS
ncbi:hypothetical protein [Streptomyces sp. NPDC096339]|uniref:hypothetical protein n=1 Tax=Streptomyces sp. NPDC096339 TaxID=3366086 RepID=UPI0037F4A0D4